MSYVLLLLAGALLCNAIPHLANGASGASFPTPFARPRGVGLSPPLTNLLWGSANLFGGVALTAWRLPEAEPAIGLAAMAVGWLAIGVYLARHFGEVRQGAQRGT